MQPSAQLRKVSSISAIFPAYNDAGTIPSMVLIVLLALRQVTDNFEVIVQTALDAGVPMIIPHVYSSIMNDAGETKIEDVKTLKALIEKLKY